VIFDDQTAFQQVEWLEITVVKRKRAGMLKEIFNIDICG